MNGSSGNGWMLAAALALAGATEPVGAEPEGGPIERCAACHGEDGMGHGVPLVPVLAGMPAAHIEEAIYAYVDGARRCVQIEAMCQTVAALTEAEVEAVAAHYAAQTRRHSAFDHDPELATAGAALHDRLCGACHRPPDDPDVAKALGIPLHGQRPDYLRFALETYRSGDRSALLPAMAEKLDELRPGDLEALVHYYASYGHLD